MLLSRNMCAASGFDGIFLRQKQSLMNSSPILRPPTKRMSLWNLPVGISALSSSAKSVSGSVMVSSSIFSPNVK